MMSILGSSLRHDRNLILGMLDTPDECRKDDIADSCDGGSPITFTPDTLYRSFLM